MKIIGGIGEFDLVGYVGFEFVLDHEKITKRSWTILVHSLHWISISGRT